MKPVKLLKLVILFLTISLLYNACEKEASFTEEEQTSKILELQTTPNIETVSYENAGALFNNLKNRYHLDSYLQLEHAGSELARTTQDTLGITIYTDIIKEVTLNNYTSYTMLIATSNTSDSKFYNLTIEDKNGTPDLFVTKYTPTDYWLENRDKTYEGGIETMRGVDFTTIGDEEGSNDGGGVGGSGMVTSEATPYYPTDCDGVVTVSIETITICTCEGHLPSECFGCSSWEPINIPYYYCTVFYDDQADDGSSDGSTNYNPNQGGVGPSGNGNPVEPDDSSIAVLVDGGECPPLPPEAQPYDTDGECGLSAYEACLMNYDNIDALNAYYTSLSPFNVDLSSVRVPCDNIDISEAEANSKFMCIYNKLASSQGFKNLFINTFGESSEANIKFELVDLPNHIAGNNIADVGNINNQTIQINKNHLTTKHPLTMAQTIIHEAVHAYLKVKAYECGTGNTVENLNNQEIDELLNAFNFGCLSTAVDEEDLMFNVLVPYMQSILEEVYLNLVDSNDLNYDYNFWWDNSPNAQAEQWHWLNEVDNNGDTLEGCLYYTTLVGMHDTNSFNTKINSNTRHSFLYGKYNTLINNESNSQTPFNFQTCEQ